MFVWNLNYSWQTKELKKKGDLHWNYSVAFWSDSGCINNACNVVIAIWNKLLIIIIARFRKLRSVIKKWLKAANLKAKNAARTKTENEWTRSNKLQFLPRIPVENAKLGIILSVKTNINIFWSELDQVQGKFLLKSQGFSLFFFIR